MTKNNEAVEYVKRPTQDGAWYWMKRNSYLDIPVMLRTGGIWMSGFTLQFEEIEKLWPSARFYGPLIPPPEKK